MRKRTLDKIQKLIESITIPLGFGYWKVTLTSKKINGNYFAMIDYDIYEKTLRITYDKDIEAKGWQFIKNTTIHELIHAKVGIHNDEVLNFRRSKEEHMVNDIVDCIMHVMGDDK